MPYDLPMQMDVGTAELRRDIPPATSFDIRSSDSVMSALG